MKLHSICISWMYTLTVHKLVLIDAYWCVLMPIDAYCCLLVNIDAYWCLLMPILIGAYIGVYWCQLMPVGAYWCLLMPIGVYWSLSVPIDAYWCLLMSIGAFWCLFAKKVDAFLWLESVKLISTIMFTYCHRLKHMKVESRKTLNFLQNKLYNSGWHVISEL